MRCPSCGAENRDDASFCGGCGARFAAEAACPSCGRSNQLGQRFCDACGTPLTATATTRTPTPPTGPATPTAIAAGRYQVQRFLGEGGKKRVYLARDTRLDRDVAIALIKTDGLDAEGLVRLRREAQAMGRLGDHPHIVTVYDIGDEGTQPYIVSQYMAGGDVEGLLRRRQQRRLPIEQALRIADHICQALQHAHERGIVHRDLKPGNVWLGDDGSGATGDLIAKLGDFGLAVALDRSRLTIAGMMVGTVAYVPPEQALGRAPDARSDLYALGAMLYELVAGRPPFLGDDAVAVISQHINTAPVAPTWHNADVPRALEALILRLLAKAPEDRPENAAAVRDSLSAIAKSASTTAERIVPAEGNPLDRLAGGVFVGREKELDELRAGLEDALSARGRLLMLVGEPGIGKTRTAEELATYARLRHCQVLWGRCYEGEGAPAYWPWVQVIRSFVHERDPATLLSEMGTCAADIAQVVSEVRERLPGLPEAPALEPEQARFRLFDGITTFLRNASKSETLVLVLDDLHWADKPSLLLLQFLARELRGARLLVIGTYRDVELGRQHPLAQTLAELTREQLSERIVLRGLSKADVARFIEITAGIAPPEPLVAAVYKETEGNPFFVNEVVRLLVTDGRLEHTDDVKSWSVAIPQSVREVLGRRLDRLSDACNQVLTIASVIGREFGLDLLERVSDLSGDRLLEALEEALAARVTTEVPRAPGRYSFAHALIRETLYDELTTTRRVRLHRQIAEALEALYGAKPEAHLAELAYHFCEAAHGGGNAEKAVDYARRAGERAMALHAYEDAAGHFERALQAHELRDDADEEGRFELLMALADAWWDAGAYESAREVGWQAAETARRFGSAEGLIRSALSIGGRVVGFDAGLVDERLVALLDEGLAGLSGEDSPLRARAMARLAAELAFSPERERGQALAVESMAMARRVGDPTVLAYVLDNANWALWGPDNIEERLAWADEALQLSVRPGNANFAAGWRVICLMESGRLRDARADYEHFASAAEELRRPYDLGLAAALRALFALSGESLVEGERLTLQALTTGQQAQNRNALTLYGAQIAYIRREQGRTAEMLPGLDIFIQQYPAIPTWRCVRAWMRSELGQEEEARRELDELAKDGFSVLPRDMFWFVGVALLANLCWNLQDQNRAATLYELLLPHTGSWAIVVFAVSLGSISLYLGILATVLERWDNAEHHFDEALKQHERNDARAWAAWTRFYHADMVMRRDAPGDKERGLQLVGEALDAAQELGMVLLMEQALTLKLKAQGIDLKDLSTSIDAVHATVQTERPDLRPHAAPDGTVTLLFTDIEGSTALNERLGDQRWMELLRAHNAIVRERVAAHGGYEVKSQGDGFMIAFAGARRALQCAIDLQRAIAKHNRAAPEPVRVRIGLHTGDAIREGEDFFGKHVNLAARIAGEAKGGEILASSLLAELAGSAGQFAFGEARTVALKGLAGEHSVIPVAWQPSPTTSPSATV